jgi:tetratricopeptide (TPR) repeat protein
MNERKPGFRRCRTPMIIGLLVAVGFILRIWGTAGVHNRADDHLQIRQAQAAYTEYFEADLGYPVFYQYLGGYLLKGLNAFFQVIGAVEKGRLMEWDYHTTALILRLLSAFFGAASILLTFLIAKKLFGETAGLLSAFFLCFAYYHVLVGHTALLDNQMGFFILPAFLFTIAILREGKSVSYLLAGLTAGLAVASKYNAVFIVLTILVAHVLRWAGKKNILKILFDGKLFLAGGATVFGFIAGNPPIWMAFRWWWSNVTRYSRILRHQDEWMVDRTFSNIWDFLFYNKYTGAAITVHYSLKTALFVLLILGCVLMIRRRGKEDVLLLSYPFFTILIGLGFFGIVRPREHFALIPFYVIIAAAGFLWILERLKKLRPSRGAAAVLAAVLLLVSSYPSLKVAKDMLRLFSERDTCEYGEDWIYENIPPGSRNIFETYTSFIHTPFSKYTEIFPDRYKLGVHFIFGSSLKDRPFERLRKNARFVHVSNFHPQRFGGVAKYYQKEISFYRKIFREFTLVKRFALKEISSKSPTQFIFSTKQLPERDVPLIFPRQLSLIQRERDMFFDAPGEYGKSNLIIRLEGGRRAVRTILSPQPIREIVIFVAGTGGEKVRIGRDVLTVGPGGNAVHRLSSVRRIRAFSEPGTRVDIQSLDARPLLIKIHFEPLRIGYEYFQIGMWEEAAARFAEALERHPENPDAAAYLQASLRKMLRDFEPLSAREWNRALSVYDLEDMDDWTRRMERLTGMDVEFLIDSLALYLEAEDLEESLPVVFDRAFLNGKALLVERDARLNLPFFLPGDYTAEIMVFSPGGIPDADIEIVSGDRARTPAGGGPAADGFWKWEIPFRNDRGEVSLHVGIGDFPVIIDNIQIRPDIRKFFLDKKMELAFHDLEKEAERP